MKIFLSREMIERKDLSSDAIGAYVALRGLFGNTQGESKYFTINALNYTLRGFLPNSHLHIVQMKKGVMELKDKGIITNFKEAHRNEYIAALGELNVDATANISKNAQPFIVVYLDDIYKVMSVRINNDRFLLLRYYCCLMAIIDYKKKVGYETIRNLSKLSGMAQSTISKYNDLFMKNEIIYIGKSGKCMVTVGGGVQNIVNHYSRFCDKKAAVTAVAKAEKGKKLFNYSNYDSSLAMKYTYMLKGTKYDYEQVRQIFIYIHGRNEGFKKKILETKNKNLKNKLIESLKDESFFKQNYPEFYKSYNEN